MRDRGGSVRVDRQQADGSQPLASRLKRYLKDYAQFILRSDWMRIFISAGLAREGFNQRYVSRLRERHFLVIARELRKEYGIPEPRNDEELEDEIELIWSMHSSVFYIGMRKWIDALPVPKNLDRVIDMRVDAFMLGAPPVLLSARRMAPAGSASPLATLGEPGLCIGRHRRRSTQRNVAGQPSAKTP